MANSKEKEGIDSVLGAMFGGAPAIAKTPTPAVAKTPIPAPIPVKPIPTIQPVENIEEEDEEGEDVPLDVVKQMFPGTPPKNIEKHYPFIMQAFKEYGMSDARLQLMAFATIRAETSSFLPISEGKSQYNTSFGGRPFDLYDNRSALGNRGAPDGDRFKGRGFVQLTGRANYTTYSQKLGLRTQLVDNPDLANDPLIAARLLVYFIKDKEKKALAALEDGDLALARKLVNGGSHGLDAFSQAFEIGAKLMGW